MSKVAAAFFASPTAVFVSAIALRATLLVYGHFQDQWSALKYTDIDYFVFTDASRYVSRQQSPYLRDTYRYTPLLAWLLVPTAWGGWWFDFGKVLFAASDVVAGWIIYTILRRHHSNMSVGRALKYSALWLLNPMVAQISTRGSSEGLLAVMVMALVWATLQRRIVLAGVFLGLAVHFKIYPFIYGISILWWMGHGHLVDPEAINLAQLSATAIIRQFLSPPNLKLLISSVFTFAVLNIAMYYVYGFPFLEHTYFYHLVRSDHRHNFSPYNLLLYLNSSPAKLSSWHAETLAFIPQLFLSAAAIPLALSRSDLPSCMLAQTFAFVTFNKVCTSQYFLWYMVFLPFYLPTSTLLQLPVTGVTALALWILGQVFWLQQGYQLEFLGRSTFIPGLLIACLFFFLVNIWILGIIVSDVRRNALSSRAQSTKKRS